MTPSGVKAALEGLELSDDARALLESTLTENATLKAKTRESETEARITELSGAGFENRPGFLKFYRQVMLSDDSAPAVVLLSDDGSASESLSALQILDRAIDAIKGSEGKVEFSDQALASGNDQKPPATADGEVERPVDERLAEAKSALGIK